MATTVHEPPQIDPRRLPRQRQSGNGDWGNLRHPTVTCAWRSNTRRRPLRPPFGCTFCRHMMFAAFSSALIVRKGSSLDWQGLRCLPSSTSTRWCLLSAASPWKSRDAESLRLWVEGFSREPNPLVVRYVVSRPAVCRWTYVAWSQLRAEGLYLATNPSSSFFYLLTVTHALHVLGGLGGLLYVIRKLNRSALRRNQLVATARYWHFMGLLWVYLLLLLWMKL